MLTSPGCWLTVALLTVDIACAPVRGPVHATSWMVKFRVATGQEAFGASTEHRRNERQKPRNHRAENCAQGATMTRWETQDDLQSVCAGGCQDFDQWNIRLAFIE